MQPLMFKDHLAPLLPVDPFFFYSSPVFGQIKRQYFKFPWISPEHLLPLFCTPVPIYMLWPFVNIRCPLSCNSYMSITSGQTSRDSRCEYLSPNGFANWKGSKHDVSLFLYNKLPWLQLHPHRLSLCASSKSLTEHFETSVCLRRPGRDLCLCHLTKLCPLAALNLAMKVRFLLAFVYRLV